MLNLPPNPENPELGPVKHKSDGPRLMTTLANVSWKYQMDGLYSASMIPDLADAEVIKAVVAGDANSFETLIIRYQGHVVRIVAKHVPPNEVEGVAHEVFVQAFRGIAKYRGDSPFSHWLSKIAVRRCCDFWRESKGRKELSVSSLSDEAEVWLERFSIKASNEQFQELVDQREAREVLDYCLAKLSGQERVLLSLVYWEDKTLAEVAALFGWSVVRVKVTMHRTRKKLRQILEEIS